jgi:glycosidase
MDFVPNHFSSAHRYYADAERNERRSAYFEWFERSDSGEAMHYFDWDNLKNLEYDHEEVQNYMLEAFSYWVREFEIDGFRVDVSWGVRERAPEFWPRWRAELKRIDPDLLLIAEASALDPFYVTNGFDAAYDWTSKLGEWAWQDVFAGKNSRPDLQRLRAALAKSTVDLPGRGLVLRFLNNNDTGPRFVTRHGVEQTRVAAAMLFTLPGLPLVYNGDEVGAEFQPYEEQPISWRDRHGLLPYYSRLIELRREVAALSTPHIQLLNTNHDGSVLAYVRKLDPVFPVSTAGNPNPADVLVLLNFTKDAVDLQLPSVAAVGALFAGGSLKDLLTGERIPAVTSMTLRLEPFQARVLSR